MGLEPETAGLLADAADDGLEHARRHTRTRARLLQQRTRSRVRGGVRRTAVRGLNSRNNIPPPSDPIHEAASRWNLDVRESIADDNAKGIRVPETHFHWQFSFDGMCKHDVLRRTFEELRSAAAALEGWTES